MQRSAALAPPVAPPWSRAAATLADWRERLADPQQRPALLWRAGWWPFWVWSDIPAPPLPHRDATPPAELGLAGQAVASGIDRVRRRLWVSHAAAALCRGAFLGLLVAAVLMLLDVIGGPVFDPRLAIAIGALFLGAGIVLAAISKPSRTVTARMLDRTFGLHERLTTALDDLGLGVPVAGQRAPVVYLQMADAANAIAVLRNDRRLRPVLPVREIVLIVLAALILTTLAFVRGLGGGLPALAEAHVPDFTPAIERPAEPEPSQTDAAAAAATPTVQEVQQRSDRSSQARRDLQTLAAALADHAVTRPAAEQIARGNYDAAGDQLREAANQAGDLSQNARDALSGDLQRASESMEPETSGLQEATRDAASGLQQGDDAARNEMRDLANAVENAGAQVVPQDELASQMRSAQQAAQAQSGGADRASSADGGDASDPPSQSSPSDDPGSGVSADSSVNSSAMQQRGDQGSQASGEQSQGQEGQPGGGQPGQAGAPGDGEQGAEGAGRSPGDAAQSGAGTAAMEGADSAVAQRGGGAGTGEAAQEPGNQTVSAGGGSQAGEASEQAADPNVSNSSGAEADPSALGNAQERIALPAGSGDQGVQTSANGGSALRGSGAGVTTGSGSAVQGEVGEAGPDSNRVPPQHRDTVERYFSEGEGQ